MIDNRICLLLSLVIFFASDHLAAQSDENRNPIWNRDEATGSWGGFRSSLSESGIEFEAHIMSDLMSNTTGGIDQKSTLLQLSSIKMLINAESLLGIKEMNFLISGLQSNGQSISELAGDLQGISNIETEQTVRLYEAWLQQNVFDERISLLAGLYDINSEFDYIESAALFMHSSQGLGGAFAASGLVGPPTFPFGGLGARIKFLPYPSLYLKAGIFDGVPSNGMSAEHANLTWEADGGSLALAEVGILSFGSNRNENAAVITTVRDRRHIGREVASNYEAKFAIGFWSYSKNYLDERFGFKANSDINHQNDKGFYILADWSWTPDRLRAYQEISVYGRIGFTDDDVSRLASYRGGGITFSGIFRADPEGELGISIASAENSQVYNNLFPKTANTETVFELTYLTKMIPWLNLQPNVQYIINPGTSEKLKNALVIGLRTDITL